MVRSRASGTPLRSQSGASSRAVRIAATGSASRRGRANRSIASDGASSHWTSSIASSSRLSTASVRKVLRKANATTPSSAGGPSDSESASAASSARRCGRGSCGNTSGTTPPIRSASPTNENAASASAGRQESTRYPRACAASTAASHSVVLPIPASPTTTAAARQLAGRFEEIEESGELVLPARKVRNADCHANSPRIVRPSGRVARELEGVVVDQSIRLSRRR